MLTASPHNWKDDIQLAWKIYAIIRNTKQQKSRTLAQKHVPHSEDGRPRQRSTVYAHEPFGHVQDRLDLLSLLQCRNWTMPKLATDKKWQIMYNVHVYPRLLENGFYFTRMATKVTIFDSGVNAVLTHLSPGQLHNVRHAAGFIC